MNLGFQFDARTVQPAEAGAPVWEGVVPMSITRTEVSDVASKDGSKMLVLHVKALAGHYTSQENVIRLNLWNKNPKASEIAQRQLSSLCHVTNKMQITDSDMLIGAPFLGMWARETRKVTDQQTGQEREVESCQCKDFRLIDGRTIKEVAAGAAASNPYTPNAAPADNSSPQGGGAQAGFQQPQGMASQPQTSMPQAQSNGAPAYTPPQQGQYTPQPQPGFAPPSAGNVPMGPGQSGAPAFGTAPAPNGMQPAPGGFASSPSSPGGFAPPGAQPGGQPLGMAAAAPQSFAQPGFGAPAGGAPPQGFGAPMAAPQGFGAPQGQAPGGQPQPGGFPAPAGSGPWAGAPQG